MYKKKKDNIEILYKKYDKKKIDEIVKKFNKSHSFELPEYSKNILTEIMDINDKVWKESLKLIYHSIKIGIMEKYMNNNNIASVKYEDDIKGKKIEFKDFVKNLITNRSTINGINTNYYLGELLIKKYGKMEFSILSGISRMFYHKKDESYYNEFVNDIINYSEKGFIYKILNIYKKVIKYDKESLLSFKRIIIFYRAIFSKFKNIRRLSTYENINLLIDTIIKHNTLLVCESEERTKFIDTITNLVCKKDLSLFDNKNKKDFKNIVEYLKSIKNTRLTSLVTTYSDSIRGNNILHIINGYNKINIYYTILPMIFITNKYNNTFFKCNECSYNAINIGKNLHNTMLIHYLNRINNLRKSGKIKNKNDKPYFYIAIKKGIELQCLKKNIECPVFTIHELGALMFIISCISNYSTAINFINSFIENSLDMNLLKESSLLEWSKKNGFEKLFL